MFFPTRPGLSGFDHDRGVGTVVQPQESLHPEQAIRHHSCLDKILAAGGSTESFQDSSRPLLVLCIPHPGHVAKKADHAREDRINFEQWARQTVEPLPSKG